MSMEYIMSESNRGPLTTKPKIVACVTTTLPHLINLSPDKKRAFLDEVDGYVRMISKMVHRASLVLLVHLAKAAAGDIEVPDLYNKTTTYWKNWLKQTDEFLPGSDEGDTIKEMRPLVGEVTIIRSATDNLISYAATTFKTAVINNAWVPLIPRLTRLTKALVKARGASSDVSAHRLMCAIRSGESETNWPEWAREHVKSVRDRLDAGDDGKFIGDNHGERVAFRTIFMFNVWMSEQFKLLGCRGMSLSPILKVKRHCVRLDRRLLETLSQRYMGRDDGERDNSERDVVRHSQGCVQAPAEANQRVCPDTTPECAVAKRPPISRIRVPMLRRYDRRGM
jgi:hypothetical protein